MGQNPEALSIDWVLGVGNEDLCPSPILFLYFCFESEKGGSEIVRDPPSFHHLQINLLKRCGKDVLSIVHVSKSLSWFSVSQKYTPSPATAVSSPSLGLAPMKEALWWVHDRGSLTGPCTNSVKWAELSLLCRQGHYGSGRLNNYVTVTAGKP